MNCEEDPTATTGADGWKTMALAVAPVLASVSSVRTAFLDLMSWNFTCPSSDPLTHVSIPSPVKAQLLKGKSKATRRNK